MEYEKINFKHTTPVQIRFNDLDVFAHVNNAVFQEYFDLGRLYYLQKVLDGELKTGENTLIIASVKTDFMEPVLLEDNIVVKTSVYAIGEKSLRMVQVLKDANTGNDKAVCESVMVAFNKKLLQSVEFPEKWKNNIISFEDKVLTGKE
ncbi:MAG: acyl-CoA thioesterase [Chlorobi bacterium]|nr:acyl-CoA thioesterase [Chlorobiota bacterium]